MKSTLSSSLLSDSQHAYRKGKSTETALHSIVSCIEPSFHHQEFTRIAFLDIEAAFNNVHPEAIMRGLQKLNIATPLVNLIHFMLTNRKVLSTLGSSTTGRKVNRGTPQGGVISPFLWFTLVNDLLKLMEPNGYNIIAYADDVAIILQGKYPQTIFYQNGLRTVGVNSAIKLKISESAKHLCIILYRKLHWNLNSADRINKATIALFTCKNAIGKRWGFNPKIIYWIYTELLDLLYGVLVWWTALNQSILG